MLCKQQSPPCMPGYVLAFCKSDCFAVNAQRMFSNAWHERRNWLLASASLSVYCRNLYCYSPSLCQGSTSLSGTHGCKVIEVLLRAVFLAHHQAWETEGHSILSNSAAAFKAFRTDRVGNLTTQQTCLQIRLLGCQGKKKVVKRCCWLFLAAETMPEVLHVRHAFLVDVMTIKYNW